MSEISINTTQNVPINFTLAPVGNRMGAYLIDASVKYAYLIVLFNMIMPALHISTFTSDYWSDVAVQIILFMPVAFYTLTQEIFFEGQTLGKKLLSIKVVKIDGYQASLSDYFIRWIFRVVEIIGPFWIIGLITMTSNKRHQRLGDIAAGTAVIALKSQVNISHTILVELADDYEPRYPQVVRLSDNDMRIIKEQFNQAMEKSDIRRISKIALKIEQITGIQREESEEDFIRRVIRDYNFYTGS
jgi:uncharacterized RDD family membrane protein YckC